MPTQLKKVTYGNGEEDWVCAKCGSDDLDFEECDCCWGEGEIDEYEEDPINADPGDLRPCYDCGGEGGWHHCRECERRSERETI